MSDVIIYQGAAIPFSFSRQNGQPLDVTSVMRTLADITTYAANTEKKYIPYEGQTIACLEDKMLYILELKNGVLVPKLSGGVKLIKRDDNVELTDDAALSALRSVKEIEDRAISRTKRDTAAEVIEFVKGLTAANGKTTVSGDGKITTLNLLVQALAETYDLNVSHVATMMRTIIKDYVSSEAFTPGLTGEGFKISKALNGDWNLEVDNIVVRKVMTIFETVISKVRSVNGGLVISDGNGRIKSVAETTGSPAYYVIGIEGDMQFLVDDFVRCQVFNGGQAKYYWVRVSSISNNSILVLKSEFTNGAVPAVGDDLVQMGNATNTARQGLIYLTASEDGKPRISVMDGVNSTSLVGKNKVILGCLDGITDTDFPADFQPSGYGLYAMNVFLKGIFVLRNGKSVEGEITAAQNAAATAQAKADMVTRLFQEFTVAGGVFESKITEVKEYADGKVAAVQVGGRNLLEKSSIEKTGDNEYLNYANTNSCFDKLGVGQYVISFDLKLSKAGDVKFYSTPGLESDFKYIFTPTTNSTISATTEYVRYSFVVDVRISNPNSSYSALAFYATYGTGRIPSVKNVKIERGNKATDWTPAPEDVTADAQAKANAAQAAAEKVAIAKATLAKTEASAYADGIVTAEEQRAIADAQAKLAEAKLDAATKANDAKQAAITDAANKYPTKTEVSTSIKQLSDSISLKAEKTEVTGLGNRVSAAEANLTVQATQIASKVSQNDFNTLGQRVGSAESAIVQQAEQISLKASKSDLNTLSGRVTSTEAELRVHATEIGMKVTAGDVSAGMTITPNKISLFAKDFSLTGMFTFESMASDAQGKINDAQNAANAAGAAAGAAKNTADKAITDAANSLVTSRNNIAAQLGYGDYDSMSAAAIAGKTIINGGKIRTELIDATAIVTGSLVSSVISATNITTGKLTVTDGAKIGGFTVKSEYNSYSLINNDLTASIVIKSDDNKSIRIGGREFYMVSISVDGSTYGYGNNGIYIRSTGDNNTSIELSTFGNSHAIKSNGSHSFLQRPGDKWNAPGVLWCGRYSSWDAYGTPTLYQSWGDGLSRTPSISRYGYGKFKITHSLGHNQYFIQAMAYNQRADGGQYLSSIANYAGIADTYFNIEFKNDGGSEQCPGEFTVCIFGRNKSM